MSSSFSKHKRLNLWSPRFLVYTLHSFRSIGIVWFQVPFSCNRSHYNTAQISNIDIHVTQNLLVHSFYQLPCSVLIMSIKHNRIEVGVPSHVQDRPLQVVPACS